jgi:hypothetical protein
MWMIMRACPVEVHVLLLQLRNLIESADRNVASLRLEAMESTQWRIPRGLEQNIYGINGVTGACSRASLLWHFTGEFLDLMAAFSLKGCVVYAFILFGNDCIFRYRSRLWAVG